METELLIGAVIVLAAIAAARLGTRFGLPALLLFLGVGLAVGEAGLGVQFDDAALAHSLGFAALALILAEGGLTTRWEAIRPAIGPAMMLATVGVGASIALMAVFGHFVLGLSWSVSVLLGAVLAPTDSAAVFSVLRGLPLPSRVVATLEGESGLNDAPVVLLVAIATSSAMGAAPEGGLAGIAGLVAFELIGGVLLGVAVGVLGSVAMRSIALPSSGLYPLATLGWAVLSYGLGSWLHMSGFAAVYISSLMLGNANLPHRVATRSFVEGVGWISQIGLFVMLGLLASPQRITLRTVAVALAAGAFLTFVVRPVAVWLSTVGFRMPWREQAFVAWSGLRGAVPIILATVPLSEGLWAGPQLFDLVFVFVIVFTVLQGPTLPLAARVLGLGGRLDSSTLDVESAPLQKISAELMHVQVPDETRMSGVAISELHLPAGAVVSLVVRRGETFVPRGDDVIRPADELLIVAPGVSRSVVEKRLRDVDESGRLARWHRRVREHDVR